MWTSFSNSLAGGAFAACRSLRPVAGSRIWAKKDVCACQLGSGRANQSAIALLRPESQACSRRYRQLTTAHPAAWRMAKLGTSVTAFSCTMRPTRIPAYGNPVNTGRSSSSIQQQHRSRCRHHSTLVSRDGGYLIVGGMGGLRSRRRAGWLARCGTDCQRTLGPSDRWQPLSRA